MVKKGKNQYWGFTLIELLTVIVILGLILLITIPIIFKIIEDAKKGAFRNSVYSYIKSSETVYAKNTLTLGVQGKGVILFVDGVETSNQPELKLEYKGTKAKDGIVIIKENGEVGAAIHNGTWCAIKKYNDPKVILEKTDFANCTLPTDVPEGWIPVANADELNQIRNEGSFIFGKNTKWEGTYESGLDKNYVQVANIDLSKYSKEAGWLPIGEISETSKTAFVGKYNGSYARIDHLKINRPDMNSVGLFGNASADFNQIVIVNSDIIGGSSSAPISGGFSSYSATLSGFMRSGLVKDTFVISNVSGKDTVGGMIGFAQGVQITNSFSSSEVTSEGYAGGLIGKGIDETTCENSASVGNVTGGSTVGGLAGMLYGGKVIDSYSKGDVTGNNYAGGLIGAHYSEDSQILDSYSIGNVTGDDTVGGLVGGHFGNKIANSYSKGNITGKGYVGGLVGQMFYSNGEISNSYSEGTVTSEQNAAGGLIAQFYSLKVIDSYFKGDVTGNDYAGGLIANAYNNATSIENTYSIGNVTGGKVAGGLIGSNYEAAISKSHSIGNVTGGNVTGDGIAGGLVGRNYGKEPITDSYFEGDVTGKEQVGGLVGANHGKGIIKSYSKANITGIEKVGGLVGANFSDIIKSYSKGSVTGDDMVGGLIGGNYAELTDSYFEGDVTGKEQVGGLVGAHYGKEIIKSYSKANVTGIEKVGGLVGDSYYPIVQSYSVSNVIGEQYVGGLIGRNVASISESYSSGSVTGTIMYTGGLIGQSWSTTSKPIIKNSYSNNNVNGVNNVGCLIGEVDNQQITIENVYCIGDVTGSGSKVGGLLWESDENPVITISSTYYKNLPNNGLGTYTTEAEMKKKTTYTGWDFNKIWTISENEFPKLRNVVK